MLLTSKHMVTTAGSNPVWSGYWKDYYFVSDWDGEPLDDATHWQPLPDAPA